MHCEFKEQPKCDVDCQNGGLCNKGVKDYDHLSDDIQVYFTDDPTEVTDDIKLWRDDDDEAEDDFGNTVDDLRGIDDLEQDGESYCLCTGGWTGRTCEVQIDKCGQDQCLNGATCRSNEEDDNDSTNFYCDCSDITDKDGSIVPHAGKSCERIYSTMCDPPEGYSASEFFCTNEGECAEDP